jgi:hypothetical protein
MKKPVQGQAAFVTASVFAVSSLTMMANAAFAPSLPGLAAVFAITSHI